MFCFVEMGLILLYEAIEELGEVVLDYGPVDKNYAFSVPVPKWISIPH